MFYRAMPKSGYLIRYWFTFSQIGSLEESVTKNTFYSILIPCLYNSDQDIFKLFLFFFAKQEYIFSVLVEGDSIFLLHLTDSSNLG